MNYESYLPHLPPSEMDAQHLGTWHVPEPAYPPDTYLPQLVAKTMRDAARSVLMTRQFWAAPIPLLPLRVPCLDAVPDP
jgi:hypothetical protein